MKRNKITKGICALLICAITSNLTSPASKAETTRMQLETVYLDGVEYSVEMDIDSGDIIINGEIESGFIEMVMETNGETEVELENDGKTEFYEADVENLTYDNVDIDLYQDGELVEEYDAYEDIVEDVYEEQAITAGITVELVVGLVFTIYVAAKTVKMVNGITRILAKTFYKVITVDKAGTKTEEKAKAEYYPAYISNHKTYICPKGLSKTQAAKLIKKDLNVYSFSRGMARRVIIAAGYSPVNSDGEKIGEIHTKNCEGNYVYRHYHKGTGEPLHKTGFAHALYGSPYYVK